MADIRFFESVGFTVYEAKAIISMLKLGAISPSEISFDSGVPQNKLYSILKRFEEKGIVAQLAGEKRKYCIINLHTHVKGLIDKKEKDLSHLKKESLGLKNIPLEMPKEEASFSIMKGQRTIMNKLAEQNMLAKREILGVQRSGKLWNEGIASMRSSIRQGVDVKLIYAVEDKNQKRIMEWKRIGCEIREYNKRFGETPLRFTIFDNELARITFGKPEITDPKNYITIWTRSKPLISVLRSQFFLMWKGSKQF